MQWVAALWTYVALFLTLVIGGALVRRRAPSRLSHVQRSWTLYGVGLAFALASLGLGAIGAATWVPRLSLVASLMHAYSLVTIAGVILFDLLLPALRTTFNRLTAELLAGLGYVVATLAVLRASGMDASSVVASTAILSGVLALSLQATLGNILGGIALQLDGSIRVGDWVQLENGRQGKVVAIRWRHTVLETRDWDQLIVPNANLLQGQIQILGKRMGQEIVQHRMTLHFAVDFRTPPQEVCRVIQTALRASPIPGIAEDPPPICQISDLARDGRDHAATYLVRYWLRDLDADDLAQSRVRIRVYTALERAQIPLALPQRTLHLAGTVPSHLKEDARPAIVAGAQLFDSLDADQKADLATSLERVPFVEGETIARAGDDPRWLYILAAGRVSVRARRPDGGFHEFAELEAPDFFGEMGLMTGEPRTADVVALGDVEAYRLERAPFQRLLLASPEIVERISDVLARRRVSLEVAREGLDLASQRTREANESKQLLGRIRSFFGLERP